MRVRGAIAALAVVVTAGCTTTVTGHGSGNGGAPPGSTSLSSPNPSSPTPSSPGTSAAPANCPATYRAPDPHRPRVVLRFDVAADLATVSGHEQVEFTPDRDITELVFRLTANTAPTVAEGNRIEVTSASSDPEGQAPTYSQDSAAAGTQGGLLHIPFPEPVKAGTTIHADLRFKLTLGEQSFDRFGRAGGYAWFASAQPLLAWERGYGWHTEPMIQFPAESATSEAAQTDLTVSAPANDAVIMSGDPSDPTQVVDDGRRTWHAELAAARDVSVAIGPFQLADVAVGSLRLRVGAFSAAERDRLVPEFERALRELSKRFGPYPFPSLSVARLPTSGGGIEYPSSILMLDSSRLVAVHETAHQWFYAMVGDSQAEHPWLDEAFASYAEQLVNGDAPPEYLVNVPGKVDTPTAAYGYDERKYYFITYDKGAAALHRARAVAGPARFDAAIRCYVNANAWRIANPSDLESALSGLPAAVNVLRQAGALP